jgi:hypothetical protein
MRPPGVRVARRSEMSPVRRGGVLLRGAQGGSLFGAQKLVPRAAVVRVGGEVDAISSYLRIISSLYSISKRKQDGQGSHGTYIARQQGRQAYRS